MDLELDLNKIADEIRTYGAIAIIGAGVSKDIGFPLNAQLQTLLWHALDSDTALIERLSFLCNAHATTAKDIVGEDNERQRIAYKEPAAHKNARLAYQYGFAALKKDRVQTPSRAHDVIAELLHRGAIDLNASKMIMRLERET